jgi:hypothetical protein
MRWAGHVACRGEERLDKHEGKRRLARTRNRLENNIKMDLQGGWMRTWTGFVWLMIGTGGGIL